MGHKIRRHFVRHRFCHQRGLGGLRGGAVTGLIGKPAQFGLSNARSTLQLVTEFFNTADPQSLPGQTNVEFGLQDSTLQFGRMTMTQGKAFAVGDGGGQTNLLGRLKAGMTSVYKRWIHAGGRTFLIEEVPLVRLTNDLAALPLTASAALPGGQRLMALRITSAAIS